MMVNNLIDILNIIYLLLIQNVTNDKKFKLKELIYSMDFYFIKKKELDV